MNAFNWRVLLIVWLVSTLLLQGAYGSDSADDDHTIENPEDDEYDDDDYDDDDYDLHDGYCSNEGVNGESTCGAGVMDDSHDDDSHDDDSHDDDSDDFEEDRQYEDEFDSREEVNYWEEVYHEFDCKTHLDVHSMSEQSWQFVRDRFDIFVHENDKKNQKKNIRTMRDGFYVPYEIQFNYDDDDDSSHPLHGIYAKEFIPKGTLVYRASIQGARFASFDQFIDFLDQMDLSPVMKCNLLFWSYGIGPSDPTFVLMDDASLMNTKWYFSHTEEVENNIGLICPHEKCINNDSYYALRDIQENEEIISDFDISTTGSHYMGKHFDHNSLSIDNKMENLNVFDVNKLHWWIYNPLIKMGDVRNLYNCDYIIYNTPRPIHKPEVWDVLRQHYYQQHPQSKGKKEKAAIFSSSSHSSGFQVPYEVRYIEGRGRCVFATDLIPEGKIVFDDEPYMAKFTTRLDFLRYLATLPLSNDMVCDILEWSYASNFNDYYGGDSNDLSNVAIVFVMDEGSLMNDAGDEAWEENLQFIPNVGCPHKTEGQRSKDCVTQLYALEDIQPGEELTCNYHDFCRTYYWEVFGL